MKNDNVPRNGKIIVMVNPDIREKFYKTANEMGMSVSSLGAYVVADWLQRRALKQKALQKSV